MVYNIPSIFIYKEAWLGRKSYDNLPSTRYIKDKNPMYLII